MKKLLSCILSICLVFALNITAYAGNQTSGTTTITTTIESKYVVEIPADTAIVYGAATSPIGSINVSALQIKIGEQLVITTNPTGNLRNSTDATKVIPYTMKCDGATFNNIVFTSVGSKALSVEIASTSWNTAAAGSYSDKITFSFAAVPIPR